MTNPEAYMRDPNPHAPSTLDEAWAIRPWNVDVRWSADALRDAEFVRRDAQIFAQAAAVALPQGALSSTALAALEKLCEAATPGRWLQQNTTVYALNEDGVNRFSAIMQGAHTGEDELRATAAAIVALFNAFPFLAATIRASEARIGELTEERDEWRRVFEESSGWAGKLEAQRDAALAEVERLKGENENLFDDIEDWLTTHGFECPSALKDHIDGVNARLASARPSAPAPDRGVPGQDEENDRLYQALDRHAERRLQRNRQAFQREYAREGELQKHIKKQAAEITQLRANIDAVSTGEGCALRILEEAQKRATASLKEIDRLRELVLAAAVPEGLFGGPLTRSRLKRR